MDKRDKREKASDVAQGFEPVFGSPYILEDLLSEMESLTVEVRESGKIPRQAELSRTTVYTKRTLPGEYINCSNTFCYNGGFSIGNILHKMFENRNTELETLELCQGYEGSPKGKRYYRECLNGFHIKINIKYKSINKNN